MTLAFWAVLAVSIFALLGVWEMRRRSYPAEIPLWLGAGPLLLWCAWDIVGSMAWSPIAPLIVENLGTVPVAMTPLDAEGRVRLQFSRTGLSMRSPEHLPIRRGTRHPLRVGERRQLFLLEDGLPLTLLLVESERGSAVLRLGALHGQPRRRTVAITDRLGVQSSAHALARKVTDARQERLWRWSMAYPLGAWAVSTIVVLRWRLTRVWRPRRQRQLAALAALRRCARALEECPRCRKKQRVGNSSCACGEDLDRARARDRTRFWACSRVGDGGEAREFIGRSLEQAARVVLQSGYA